MDVVLGAAPEAASLAGALGLRGQATLVSPTSVQGPFLWRRGDPASGEGVLAAMRAASRVFLVAERAADAIGVLSTLKPGTVSAPTVLLLPANLPPPEALSRHPSWATLQHAAVWGPQDPWVRAWRARLAAGQRIWAPTLPAVRALSARQLADVAVACVASGAARWRVCGDEAVTVQDLAEALARPSGKVSTAPMVVSARLGPLDATHAQRWTSWEAAAGRHTPGFDGALRPDKLGWAWPLMMPDTNRAQLEKPPAPR